MKYKITDVLKDECKKQGITLSDIARRAKVGRTTLQDWTTGSQPKVEHLKKVSAALGLSIHYLLFGEEDPQANEGKSLVVLEDLFSGDIRISIQKIKRIQGND